MCGQRAVESPPGCYIAFVEDVDVIEESSIAINKERI
jgi:hypothetical protein